MKAFGAVLLALSLLGSSAGAWASVGDCSPMMRAHRCCCHHGKGMRTPVDRDALASEPMHCCDTVAACASPTQAPASSIALQVDAPSAAPAPLFIDLAPAHSVEPTLLERSRAPPGSARALYLHNCSWLS